MAGVLDKDRAASGIEARDDLRIDAAVVEGAWDQHECRFVARAFGQCQRGALDQGPADREFRCNSLGAEGSVARATRQLPATSISTDGTVFRSESMTKRSAVTGG